MMSSLSAIILARNEEQHIVDCIKSIQCANEILVIDDGSTDRTVELAESLGAVVIPHPLIMTGLSSDALALVKHPVIGSYLLMQMNEFLQN